MMIGCQNQLRLIYWIGFEWDAPQVVINLILIWYVSDC